MNGHGLNWKLRKFKKEKRASRTPGKIKVKTCQHTPLKKYLATRSRSYKHPDYSNWNEIFGKR